MSSTSINIQNKLASFSDLWSPKVIAELNDYQIKLVKVAGVFDWHEHTETDELFFCLHGALTIEMRDGSVDLREGEIFVVPKGVLHRPVADEECHVMLIEPRGVVNTGDEQSELTAPGDQWI